MDIKAAIDVRPNSKIPKLAPGDTIKVTFRITESGKERAQNFQGVVIGIKEGVPAGSFIVRRSTYGVGVERTFFYLSPLINKVEVLRHGKVRRAKLYYLRRLSAKEARLKERQEIVAEKTAAAPLATATEALTTATAATATATAVAETPAASTPPAETKPGA